MATTLIHLRPTSDGQLKAEPADQLDDDLRQFIRSNKAALVEAGASVLVLTDAPESVANPEQLPHWLDELAELLHCEPAYLLSTGAIDCHDLIEQDGSNLQAMVDLIRSNPDWKPQLNWKQIGREHAEATRATRTAAGAAPQWLSARDAFHNHWAACLDCHPQMGRYCPAGAELRQQYQTVTDQEEATA